MSLAFPFLLSYMYRQSVSVSYTVMVNKTASERYQFFNIYKCYCNWLFKVEWEPVTCGTFIYDFAVVCLTPSGPADEQIN